MNKTQQMVVNFLLSVALFLAWGLVRAGADVKGSKDHALLKRMEGSWIYAYEFYEFNDHNLVIGPAAYKKNQFVPTKTLPLEGSYTRILYSVPSARGTLEVLRNYQNHFAEIGEVEELFSCKGKECVPNHPLTERFKTILLTKERPLKGQKALGRSKDIRYWAGKVTTPDGTQLYIGLYVDVNTGGSNYAKKVGIANTTIALLEVLEVESMENTMVTVQADEMAAEIGKEGHIALYGIYFDFDSDKLKPQSDEALSEIAKLLNGDPSLKLHVVGHTDNQGSSEYNLGLSTRRAQSVIKALETRYGIAPSRLSPFGNGFYAPVASNRTEEGRALNRRVELVEH